MGKLLAQVGSDGGLGGGRSWLTDGMSLEGRLRPTLQPISLPPHSTSGTDETHLDGGGLPPEAHWQDVFRVTIDSVLLLHENHEVIGRLPFTGQETPGYVLVEQMRQE